MAWGQRLKNAWKVIQQIFAEGIAPVLLAGGWTFYSTEMTAPWPDIVGKFMASVAVTAFLTMQVFRIIKQQGQDRKMKAISGQVEVVTLELRQAADRLVGLTTGGSTRTKLVISDDRKYGFGVSVALETVGDYPLLDFELKVYQKGFYAPPGKLVLEYPHQRIVRHRHPHPGFRPVLAQGIKESYAFFCCARNGIWWHEFAMVLDGEKLWIATRDDMSEEDIPEGFPGFDPNASDARLLFWN